MCQSLSWRGSCGFIHTNERGRVGERGLNGTFKKLSTDDPCCGAFEKRSDASGLIHGSIRKLFFQWENAWLRARLRTSTTRNSAAWLFLVAVQFRNWRAGFRRSDSAQGQSFSGKLRTEGGVGPWDSHGAERFHLRPTMPAQTLVAIPVEILLDICRLVSPKDAVHLCMVTKLFMR